jgi:mRNA-degrading endonuclease RelE of RelBE toxin-antitoxin system
MPYNVKTISVFEKQYKRLYRKYPSLKKDLLTLIHQLQNNPHTGVSIGNHCYKIRVAITSKAKGKSGGARLITHVVIKDEVVYLLSIYDKSEKSDLSTNELVLLLKAII